MSSYINCTIDGHIAIVLLNRPAVCYTLNLEMIAELYDAMREVNANEAIKAVILFGNGINAFSSSADIEAMEGMDADEAKEVAVRAKEALDFIAKMRPTTIAAINGYAINGGFELVMACDKRVASTKAELGFSEKRVSAVQAKELGLVEAVVDTTEVVSCCLELADQIG